MKKILTALILCAALALTSTAAYGGNYQITSEPANEECPSMTAEGGRFYVAYISGSGIFVGEYDKGLELIKKYRVTGEVLLYSHPSLIYADNHFYVAYASKESEGESFNIFVKKFDKDFGLVESYRITDQAENQSHPSIAYSDNAFYVAYASDARGGDIFVRKYDENFTYLARYPISTKPSFQGHPSISYMGDSFYVTYTSDEGGNDDVFVKKYDKNFDFHNEKYQITDNEFSQQYPSITYSENTFYIAYASDEKGNYDIFVKEYLGDPEQFNLMSEHQLTTPESRESDPSAVFSDSLYVTYQSDEAGYENLFVWTFKKEAEDEITEVRIEDAPNITISNITAGEAPPPTSGLLNLNLIITASIIGTAIIIIAGMLLLKREL